jgi:Cu-processing system permease protein
MIDFTNVLALTQKELADARRNRWLLMYAFAFAALSLALAWFALSGAGNYGLAGFGRTSASLINLVLLIVPLMGLTLGALSLASERENGTLAYLLAQPVNKLEVLLGKFLGLSFALIAALGLGFGLTALLIAIRGGTAELSIYLNLLAFSSLLAIASLSLGLLLSVAVRRAATAVGLAVLLWLTLVFFGDLGIMGTAMVMRLDVDQLFALSLINPLQIFKIAAIMGIRNNLEVLGPAGIYALRAYGPRLVPFLLFLLLLWAFIPLFVTTRLFRKTGIL